MDADRNVDYSTLTDSAGRYIFPTLPAARYVLTRGSPRLRQSDPAAILLEVQQQVTADVELQVGEVTSTVEVQIHRAAAEHHFGHAWTGASRTARS